MRMERENRRKSGNRQGMGLLFTPNNAAVTGQDAGAMLCAILRWVEKRGWHRSDSVNSGTVRDPEIAREIIIGYGSHEFWRKARGKLHARRMNWTAAGLGEFLINILDA